MTIRRVKNGEEKRKRFESRIICKSSPKVKKKKKKWEKIDRKFARPSAFFQNARLRNEKERGRGEGEKKKKEIEEEIKMVERKGVSYSRETSQRTDSRSRWQEPWY